MEAVISADGTAIAFERTGRGPVLILVDGAMCHWGFGPMRPLAQCLAPDFTVYGYDRRGRGRSGDTAPYAVEREVEDLAALIGAAGGRAFVYGLSSGAALALEAAARGLAVAKLALYEPAYTAEAGDPQLKRDYAARLAALLAADRRGDAVGSFMALVGMPAAAIAGMRRAPEWPRFEALAPTLAYDDAVLGDGTVPRARAALVAVPTLVLDGGASPEALRRAARETARAIPGAGHRTLAGQTHSVAPTALAPVLADFFLSGTEPAVGPGQDV